MASMSTVNFSNTGGVQTVESHSDNNVQRVGYAVGRPARGGAVSSGRGGARTPGYTSRGTPLPQTNTSRPGGERTSGPAGQGTPLLGQKPDQQRGITVKEIKERTIRVTLPRSVSFTRMDFAEAMKKVEVPLSEIEAIGTRQNNYQWYITFKSGVQVNKLLAQGVLQVAGKSGYISSLDERTHRVRIHWAPYHLSPHKLTEAFQGALPEGATLVSTGWERSQISGLQHAATLVRYAVVQYDGDASNLPHILKVTQYNETFELLLTIQGRQPICLRCRQVGHLRSQCVTCNLCGSHNHITARCVYTYAGKAAGREEHDSEEAMEEADEEAEEGSVGGGSQESPDVAQLSLAGGEFPPLHQDLVPETQNVIPDTQPLAPEQSAESLAQAPPGASAAVLVDKASSSVLVEETSSAALEADPAVDDPAPGDLATGDLVLEATPTTSVVEVAQVSASAPASGPWSSPSDTQLAEIPLSQESPPLNQVEMALNQVRPSEVEDGQEEGSDSELRLTSEEEDSSGDSTVNWAMTSSKRKRRRRSRNK